MTCRVTIDDGTAQAIVENQQALSVDYDTLSGGGAILRFLDGTAAKQHRWRKESITVRATGKVPVGVRDLDYSKTLTVTVETGLGTDVYSCLSLGPQEQWDLNGARAQWTLRMEQT